MYKVNLEKLDTLNILLSISDFDYIDTIFNKNSVSFIVNYSGIFAFLSLKCESSISAGVDYARIPRKAFTNLIQVGTLVFNLQKDAGKVYIDFLDKEDNCYCSINFDKQVVQMYSYKDKLDLIGKFKDNAITQETYKYNSNKVTLAPLVIFNKINKLIKGDITVDSEFISMSLTDGKIFTENSSKDSFTISQYACSLLLKCSTIGYSIENYIIASKDNLFVIATKSRKQEIIDFNDFIGEKSKLNCTVDLTNIRYFIYKIKCTADYLTLDLTEKVCIVKQDNVTYKIPIKVKELVKSKVVENSQINIPVSVVKEVLNNVDVKDVKLFRKRTFTQLKIANLVVVFS